MFILDFSSNRKKKKKEKKKKKKMMMMHATKRKAIKDPLMNNFSGEEIGHFLPHSPTNSSCIDDLNLGNLIGTNNVVLRQLSSLFKNSK